jgi:glycerophosphoryl diester phosphodiesterase
MEIIGHRGMPNADAPENTMASVHAALEADADGVEIDVRLTSDDVAVCCHDPGLTRLAGVSRGVRSLTHAELTCVRVQGHPIPTVAEVSRAIPDGHRLVLDLKPEHRPRRLLLAVLDSLAGNPGVKVLLSSCDENVLEMCARLAPALPRAAVLREAEPFSRVLSQVLRRGDTAVHLPLRSVFNAPEIVQVAHAHGLLVRVWTVNRVVDARLLRVLGVEALITDVPAQLRDALGARRPLQLAD